MNQNVKKKTETRANKKGQKKSIGISIGYIGLGKYIRFVFGKKFLETILGFGFVMFGLGEKVSFSVSVTIFVSSYSAEDIDLFHHI